MQPNFEFTPGELKAIQDLEQTLAQKNGFVPTINYLLGKWNRFVKRVEDGYDLSFDDYTISLIKRSYLQKYQDICPENKKLAVYLEGLDWRFMNVTLQVKEPLLNYEGWWWYRIPAYPGENLRRWFWRVGQAEFINFEEESRPDLQKFFRENNFRQYKKMQAALKKVRQDFSELEEVDVQLKEFIDALKGWVDTEWENEFFRNLIILQLLVYDLEDSGKRIYSEEELEEPLETLDELDRIVNQKLADYPADMVLMD